MEDEAREEGSTSVHLSLWAKAHERSVSIIVIDNLGTGITLDGQVPLPASWGPSQTGHRNVPKRSGQAPSCPGCSSEEGDPCDPATAKLHATIMDQHPPSLQSTIKI